MKVETEEII